MLSAEGVTDRKFNKSSISHFYVAEGFTEDCNNFYDEYLKYENVKFSQFCDLWKNMKMSLVFKGRPSPAEVMELTEEIFHLAKTLYFCQSLGEFKKQLFALYLMYALYYQQPYPNLMKYLVTKSDCDQFAAFKDVLKKQNHYEGLYLLSKMIREGVFQFCLSGRDYGTEISRRKYYEGPFGALSNPYSVTSSLVELLGDWDNNTASSKGAHTHESNDYVDFAVVHKTLAEYQKAKSKISGNTNHATRDGLKYVDHDIMTKLVESLKVTTFYQNSVRENEDMGKRRAVIKRKAFQHKMESKRHRIE